MNAQLKTIGSSGQISLGKQHAGRQVLVEEQEDGVWLVRTAQVIPDNERWLHTPEAKAALTKAFAWAATHTPVETDLDEFFSSLEAEINEPKAKRKTIKLVGSIAGQGRSERARPARKSQSARKA